MEHLTFRRRALRWAIAAWLGGFGWIAPALAQAPDVYEGVGPVPGWVFTPSVRFAGSFDDNVTYRGHGDLLTRDYLTTVGPTLDLDFTGRRTRFMLDYGGAFLLYRSLDELNAFDQSASTELRVRTSRHVTWFGRSSFALAPTTDQLQLGGIPFMRMGSRRYDAGTGFEAFVTRRTSINAGYDFQWVHFQSEPIVSAILRGGYSHGGSFDVRHELNDRVAVGADYSFTRALVGSPDTLTGSDTFGIHSTDGRVEFKPAESVTLEASAGIAFLRIGSSDNRSGLSWRFAAAKRTEHASLMAAYFRSFVPSFGFGGTVQNQELTAQVRAPFARTRAYAVGGGSYRINTPLTPGEIELHSVWVNMTVGYEVSRRLQIEGFYTGLFQNTRLAGGRLDRNQIGFQIVTAAPMRIH